MVGTKMTSSLLQSAGLSVTEMGVGCMPALSSWSVSPPQPLWLFLTEVRTQVTVTPGFSQAYAASEQAQGVKAGVAQT